MEIKDIENLAKLCRIKLSANEKTELLGEISSILGFVEQVQNVETEGKKIPLGELRNVMREDKNPRASGLYTESILAEAPRTERGYIKVKKIL